MVVCQTRVEGGRWFAPSLANFISFERAFHDIGDGPTFATCQAVRQIASLGATYRELGFRQMARWQPGLCRHIKEVRR